MLYYYLKIAIRSFRKTISASLINVLGLSAGLTIVFFIVVWLNNELTYDRFHEHAEEIYLLTSKKGSDAHFREYTPLLIPVPEVFKEFPEVKSNVSIVPLDEVRVSNGQKSFTAKGLAVTRPFFQTFNFPFLSGTYEPYTDSTKVIYLTERLAYKIFNSTALVGKLVDFDFDGSSNKGFLIAGILEDPPDNSSIKFEFLLPYYVNSFWGRMGFDYLTLLLRVERFVTWPLPHRPVRAAFPHTVPLSWVSLKDSCDTPWVLRVVTKP